MYLGIDLGTSGVKTVVTNTSGQVIATANRSLTVSNPNPTWSEQSPEDWWVATVECFAELQKKLEGKLTELRSIGLAGQMHGATLLDKNNRVLRPCMLWNDGRAKEQCVQLEQSMSDFHARSGNLAMPGFTAPKILWVAQNEPEIFKNIHKVLLPKDYLCFRLTGKYVSDMSDASGTLWLNPETRDWDDQLLAATGLDRKHMPELLEGNQAAGLLSAEASSALGIRPIPVVIGGGDNACGAIGVGVTEPGQSLISLGTSGVMFIVSNGHLASSENAVHAFCHCLPNRWHQMSVSLSAANSLSWLSRLVNQPVTHLLSELDESGITETPVVFLPYLSGERTPHNDPNASGMFFGLKNATTAAELTLSVMEGVAFSIADGARALDSAGAHPKDITLIGGGARSKRWRQILSDVLQRSLTFKDGGEVGPGLGAARLAQLSEFSCTDESTLNQKISEICYSPPIIQQHQPDLERSNYYQKKLEQYRALYLCTKDLNV